jgi:hypothetical protein
VPRLTNWNPQSRASLVRTKVSSFSRDFESDLADDNNLAALSGHHSSVAAFPSVRARHPQCCSGSEKWPLALGIVLRHTGVPSSPELSPTILSSLCLAHWLSGKKWQAPKQVGPQVSGRNLPGHLALPRSLCGLCPQPQHGLCVASVSHEV